ncbi:leucine-rich repeat protein [uncultured Actinomyces sp.]|uniref:leucine-rich repeat protein n=1 Tax=uncultured Actinomyces sp. TaxID=249061 RepID=UPI00260BE80C|nr:leucine-rich repeat protein [uncultured Actinomyces sp.]
MSHRKSMVLAFALAGALSLTAVSMPAAFAADTGTGGQVNAAAAPQANNDEFTIDADGVLVAYTGGATDIRIPEGVTKISSNAFTSAQLTSVWIPASVRAIDDSAFAGQPLTQVTFQDDEAHPSQLETIGDRAFSYTPLESVSLPRSLKTAGLETFSDMAKLRSVNVGPHVQADGLFATFARTPLLESIEVDAANQNYQSLDGVLYTKDLTHLATYPQAKNSGGSYTVAEETAFIDEGAFASAQITSVTLPSHLRNVGKGAFVGARITSLTLPDAFESMDDTAFWYMSKLERVDLGGATILSDSAFRYDRALAEVNFRPDLNRLAEVGDYAFDTTALTSATLPDSVTSIGKGAFSADTALTSVHLGSGIATIGESAFVDANNLASLTVDPANTVYSVEDGALYGKGDAGRTLVLYLPTKTDTDVTVPKGTTAIADAAFANNSSLRRVVLPEGLTTIGYGAFDGDANLADIVIPDSVTVARGLVNNGLDTIELGTKVTELWMTPRATTTPRHIIVHGGNDGEFYYEGKASNGRPDSAYFGEGMTRFTFWFDTPRVLVLPSTVEEIKLAADMDDDLKANTEIYVAAPKGSKAWTLTETAMKNAGYNTESLFEYTTPQVSVSGTGINEAGAGYTLTTTVGAPTTINVSAQGGTLGGRELRVVQVSADGTDTVLQDWASMQGSSDQSASTASYTWTPTSAEASLRFDVRQDPHAVTSTTVKASSDTTPAQGQWVWGARGWWYRYADGTYPSNTAKTIGGKVYRFDADGYMRTGWVFEQGLWYYHAVSGAQATGWVLDGISWYYMDLSTGAMATGWVTVGSHSYYLDPQTGIMKTGWLKDGDSWYYLKPGSGQMATGRVWIGWRYYRFSETGQLIR